MAVTNIFDGPPISYVDPLVATTPGRRLRRQQNGPLRRDIQGLRMVAVVAVVANHLTGHPQGGFVGVDVFFVISGFLITGILIRDLDKSVGPATYIGNFYRRRIRRILPAGLLVIALTVLAARQVFNGARYAQTLHDGGWAAIFWANWHFVSVQTNYFTAGGPESPLQHYWSLAVEEQFYIVWPIALFCVAAAVARKGSTARRAAAGGTAAAVTVASLAFAFHQTSSAPQVAYFSTFARGWELGLGAILASAVPYLRMPRSLLTLMSWGGLAAIAISLFITKGGSGFPAPGALLPCIGSALVIAATSSDGNTARNWLLTNRVSNWIGDISYSVYLVHFPVIVLLGARMTDRGASFYTAAIALTVSLATALYGLVERPVLQSNFLLPKGGRRPKQVDAAAISARTYALVALAAVVVAGMAVVAEPDSAVTQARRIEQLTGAAQRASSAAKSTPPLGASGKALSHELYQALGATSWPALTPPIDKLLADPADGQATPLVKQCANPKHSINPAGCTVGSSSARRTAVIVGDSLDQAYGVAFQSLASTANQEVKDWKFVVLTSIGCTFTPPPYRNFVDNATRTASDCTKRYNQEASFITKTKPDLVITTNWADNDVEGRNTIAVMKALNLGQRFLFLMPAPDTKDPATCYTRGSVPSACVGTIGAEWRGQLSAIQDAAKSLGGKVIDTSSLFCYYSQCPEFAGTVPTRIDSHHASAAYSEKMAPALAEMLSRAHAL